MPDDIDVLLISTYDTDGAGKFTQSLAGSLRALGYSVRVVCVRHRSDSPDTVGLLDGKPLRQFIYRLWEEFDRRVSRPREEYAFIHLRKLSDRFVLSADVWPKSCRFIICTFMSGMLSPEALLELHIRFGNPPTLFYGVDMNFYTGGCHYARDCLGYHHQCRECPAIPRRLRPAVQREFIAKQACYQRITGHIVVSSSRDHHHQILSSTLFRKSEVRLLLMAVDENLYGTFEADRDDLREARGFSKRVLLLRSSSEPRKGCDMFVEAIFLLKRQAPDTLERLEIVTVGDYYVEQCLEDSNVRVRSLGYVHDEVQLARVYAIADCFVNPTLADAGPVMLAQALMSGTPVITTEVGLAQDLVSTPDNGWILAQTRAQDLVDAIKRLSDLPDRALRAMRLRARRLAKDQMGTKQYLENLSSLMNSLTERT